MGTRHTVGRVGELAQGESCSVDVAGKRIALFLSDGQYYAIDGFCPHAGAPLSGGYVEGAVVTCPWHAWRFRLSDGAWADNPRIKIGCYAVIMQGDELQVEIPEAPVKPGGGPPCAS